MKEKSIAITGGTDGMGKATAIRLAGMSAQFDRSPALTVLEPTPV